MTNGALDKYRAVRADIEKKLQEARSLAQAAFTEALMEPFDKFPELESFSWTQYTPWFNDGDECVFSVHTDPEMIYINDQKLYDYDWNSDTRKYEPEWVSDAADMVGNILESFDESDLKWIYDDHVRVTIYRDGTAEVENYSHD